MRVVVTGASGYVGRALCAYLQAQGYTVVALSRTPFLIANIESRIVSDYCQVSASDFHDVDVIVHLAARAHQPSGNPKKALQVYREANVATTSVLASAAQAAGVKRFIYLSSIKVNGESTTKPFTPNDVPAPKDAYGISKWEAEQALEHICEKGSMEWVIIRPPLVWGGEEKGNLALLNRLISKKIPLPFKSINNRRDIISRENLCSVISCSISHPKAISNRLLVSDGCALSTAQIAQLLADQSSRQARFIYVPNWVWRCLGYLPYLNRAIDKLIGNLELDISNTCQMLDWQPKQLKKEQR